MPFAPRKHSDGTWRLCQRKGPTHLNFNKDYEIRFQNHALAGAACAELNEHWEQYRKSRLKRNPPPGPVQLFFDIIDKYGGIHERR